VIEDHQQDLEDTSRSPGARTSRPRLATALAVLVAVALVAGLTLAVWLRAAGSELSDREQDRLAAVQAAQRFTETWNTFDSEEAEAYIERVSPLLSTKFRAEFTGSAEDVVTGITQQELSSQGSVLSDADGIPLVGIASLDEDSAEVLVVSDAQRVAGGQEVLRHWRWQVSLVKVDGEWLVDGFEEV
jgi:Mce-associated membrane protein